MPTYSISLQRMLVKACCIIQNFIRLSVRTDGIFLLLENMDLPTNDGDGIHPAQEVSEYRHRQVEGLISDA